MHAKSHPPSSRRRRTAFTLFEVLIALGVFAFAGIGLLGAINSVLAAGSEARLGEVVRQRLENQLALAENAELKTSQSVLRLSNPAMTITQNIRPERVTQKGHEILDGFWRVTVRAEWQSGTEKQQQEVSFLRYASK